MDWTLVLSIFGSALLATLGYFFNGRQDRTLEKRKTKYHQKLSAFRQMNGTFSRLRDNLLLLRTYTGRSWGEGDSKALDTDAMIMLSHLAIAREHAKLIGSEAIQELFEQFNETNKVQPDETRIERLREWLGSAFVSLVLFRTRLMVHSGEAFERAFLDADILIDNEEIESAANSLMTSVMEDLSRWSAEDPSKALTDQELLARLNHWGKLHKGMRDAMYNDLESTL